jgi:hypothetical protein
MASEATTYITDVIALSKAALDFELARRVAISLKDQRGACFCEEAEPAEPEVGLMDGVEPCWKRYEWTQPDDTERLEEEKWCPTCVRRQRLHEAYRKAMRVRGAKMRTFHRLALKGIESSAIESEVRRHMETNETTNDTPETPAPETTEPTPETPAETPATE